MRGGCLSFLPPGCMLTTTTYGVVGAYSRKRGREGMEMSPVAYELQARNVAA
jgi:hypothetical protein